MALRLIRFNSVDAFEQRTRDWLLEREPEHNLFIGLLGQIREGRYREWYLASVEDGGGTVAAAWRTPPHIVGLSHVEDSGAIELIAPDVHNVYGREVPGVIGAKQHARAFAPHWTSLTGMGAEVFMEQRIDQATSVDVPAGVPGEPKPATRAERDLLIEWLDAFNDDAGVAVRGESAANIDMRLDPSSSGSLELWWDGGRPVSMVGYGSPTPHGERVGPVYTPAELRGRGYASACTAVVTKRLLDGGRRFVFLYTDLSNPTSNSIYQKIGYRPVLDVDQYRFG